MDTFTNTDIFFSMNGFIPTPDTLPMVLAVCISLSSKYITMTKKETWKLKLPDMTKKRQHGNLGCLI